MKKRRFAVAEPLKNMGLITVIVPVYNAEKFLQYSLESLKNQTYPYWEAILVNDGSTDSSLKILQKYAAADSRFKLIDKPNGGVASARNAGLNAANGDFIAFLDPDDMLCPQFMDILLKTLLHNESDMVWCKKQKCNEDDDLNVCETYDKYCTVAGNWALKWFIGKQKPRLTITVWGKLYRAKVLKNLRFNPNFAVMAEDFEFSLRAFELCAKTTCVQRKLVVYRQNSASLTHRPLSFSAADDHIRLLRNAVWHFRDSLDRTIRRKMWRLLSRIVLMYVCIIPYEQAKNYVDFWDKYRPICQALENNKELFPQYLSLIYRLIYFLFKRRKYQALRLVLAIYRKHLSK